MNDPEKFSTVLQIVRDLEPHKLILQKNNIRNLNPLIALRTDTLTGINLQDNQVFCNNRLLKLFYVDYIKVKYCTRDLNVYFVGFYIIIILDSKF